MTRRGPICGRKERREQGCFLFWSINRKRGLDQATDQHRSPAAVLLVEAMASLFARAVLCQVAAPPAYRTVLFSLHIARAKQDAVAGSWSRWTPSAHSSAKVS